MLDSVYEDLFDAYLATSRKHCEAVERMTVLHRDKEHHAFRQAAQAARRLALQVESLRLALMERRRSLPGPETAK